MKLHDDKLCELGLAVIQNEAQAIADLAHRIDSHFVSACKILFSCKGRIVVTGVGKSGHIGGKIAATLASTGTPAFFVHSGEASHGDLGMITSHDVVLALSNSGETAEILAILPLIKRLGIPLIALTGNSQSTLAEFSSVHLNVGVSQEACPLGLAPTSSTTAALVMGDALAVSLLEARGFTRYDFAFSHPGGQLGRRLLLLVSDIMHTDSAIPAVNEETLVGAAVLEMTAKKLGMTAVVNSANELQGIFTDGDLRRLLGATLSLPNCRISEVMTRDCSVIHEDCLAAEAMQVMQNKKISALCVVDDAGRLCGALNMHDLIRAGIV